jgi:hypothetical protein
MHARVGHHGCHDPRPTRHDLRQASTRRACRRSRTNSAAARLGLPHQRAARPVATHVDGNAHGSREHWFGGDRAAADGSAGDVPGFRRPFRRGRASAGQVTITIRLPGGADESRIPGVVRWNKPGGIGVQFGLLGAKETHLLAEFMRHGKPLG